MHILILRVTQKDPDPLKAANLRARWDPNPQEYTISSVVSQSRVKPAVHHTKLHAHLTRRC